LGIWWSNKKLLADVRFQLKAQQNLWQSLNDWLRKTVGSMNKGAGGYYPIYHLPQFFSGRLMWAFLLLVNSFQQPYHNEFIPVV
jgi:hypothetical protein